MKYQEAFDLLKELVKEITGNSEISNDQNLIEFGLSWFKMKSGIKTLIYAIQHMWKNALGIL